MPYLYYIDFENLFVLNDYVRIMSESANNSTQMIRDDRTMFVGSENKCKYKHIHNIRVPT